MADSIDRVFGHALNTVNKIRTGSQKPPVAQRLKLYGEYKQSMEGDVTLIQDRPKGTSEQARKEQEKWDAWNANAGLSRTEAKKRYIETLIETMHRYGSTTPEAKELVGELEFVWDQIKNNSASSSSQESPLRAREDGEGYPGMGGKGQMRVLSPVSQNGEEDDDADEEEREEFVDAPVSQFGEQDYETQNATGERAVIPGASDDRPPDTQSKRTPTSDAKWRRRVESALVKMTVEVAALREQLESNRYISQRRRNSLLGWIFRSAWFFVKLVVVDVVALWIVILYLRRKKDRRLEGAVRVLLGDAVAQMQKVGREIKVPKLPSRK